MREEPVVYINGLPFVLREQQRPMKNLQEYAGIDAERLERMEARLKQDVLAEAGALLLWVSRAVLHKGCCGRQGPSGASLTEAEEDPVVCQRPKQS